MQREEIPRKDPALKTRAFPALGFLDPGATTARNKISKGNMLMPSPDGRIIFLQLLSREPGLHFD